MLIPQGAALVEILAANEPSRLVAATQFPALGSACREVPMAVARKAFYASISPPQDYGLMTGSKKIEEQAYLSIVIPVYGCVDALSQLCSQLAEHLATITESYEVILVNDASPDDSWGQIQGLAKGDSRIKGVDLSRNIGQHAAITAGLAESAGT
jgi:hypothetical protein